jgi:glutaredoxin
MGCRDNKCLRNEHGEDYSFDGLGGALVWLSVAPAEAGCSKAVTMYNADWCPYCRQVRAILARNHIRYRILDATTAPVRADMIRRFGDTGVPRTVIGGVVVNGVDEARIKQLCRG